MASHEWWWEAFHPYNYRIFLLQVFRHSAFVSFWGILHPCQDSLVKTACSLSVPSSFPPPWPCRMDGWWFSNFCLPIFLLFPYITRNLKSNDFYPETNTSTSPSPQTSSPPIFTSLSLVQLFPVKWMHYYILLYFLFWLKHVYSFSALMVTFTLLTIEGKKVCSGSL